MTRPTSQNVSTEDPSRTPGRGVECYAVGSGRPSGLGKASRAATPPSETTDWCGLFIEPPFDAVCRPPVPAGVLAERWRGGPQANLSTLLKGCDIEDLTQAQARAVGALGL